MEEATAWGASFTPISLFSEVVALLHPQRKRERGRTPPPPQEWPRRAPRAAPPVSRGNQRLPAPLNRQPVVSSRAGPEFGGFQLLARVPFRERDLQPPLHARSRLHPGTLAGEGGTRRGRCQQPTPSRGRPAEPRDREAAQPKHPALGTAPGARRRPYLLEKGAPQPGPRESAPSAPREGARRAAALRFPGAVARSGRARRAHPGPVSAALVPAGGAGWAAGARLPRPRWGSRAPLRPPGLRGARLRPGRPPPPSHALARRDRASLLSLRLRSPLRLLPPPASRANLRTGLTLQTSASGLGQKRGSGTGTRGWRPGRGARARWPGAATWSGHPP